MRRVLISVVLAIAIVAGIVTTAHAQAPGRTIAEVSSRIRGLGACGLVLDGDRFDRGSHAHLRAARLLRDHPGALCALAPVRRRDVDVDMEIVLECNNGTAIYRPVFLEKSIPDQSIPMAISPGDICR